MELRSPEASSRLFPAQCAILVRDRVRVHVLGWGVKLMLGLPSSGWRRRQWLAAAAEGILLGHRAMPALMKETCCYYYTLRKFHAPGTPHPKDTPQNRCA